MPSGRIAARPRSVAVGALLLAASAAAIAACGSEPLQGTVRLELGGETDALRRDPAVTRLVVEGVGDQGARRTLADVALPAERIDLGKYDVGAGGAFEVSAFDAAGVRRMGGRSLAFPFRFAEGADIPVFTQRLGEMARLPGGAVVPRRAGHAQFLYGRYLFMAGGEGEDDAALRAVSYDLFSLGGAEGGAKLPRPPKSLALLEGIGIVLDEQGGNAINLENLAPGPLEAPAGGQFGDVAGGITVRGPGNFQYIVGSTRRDTPSARVLQISEKGALAFYTLKAPRLGAASTFAAGTGLVVADGIGEGIAAVEVVALPSTQTRTLDLPDRGVVGSAALVLEDGRVALLGGVTRDGAAPPGIAFDPKCVANCSSTEITPALPSPLVRTQAFAFRGGYLILGDRPDDGVTLAFRVEGSAVVPVSFRVPRSGSTAVLAPTGNVLVVGGGTTEIESFLP